MTTPNILGSIQQGLGTRAQFEQLGAIRDNREQARLAAKQQELIGGLRRKSLGLGGATPEQQQEARLELLSASPAAAKEFFTVFSALPTPEQDKIKDRNQKIGLAAANNLQFEDDQLAPSLTQTASAFANSGEPELAQRTLELAQLAQQDPQAARQRLTALQTQIRDVEKVLSGSVPATQKEFAKEERQQAKSTVNRLSKRATEINSSYDKVMTLLDQNSRAANASVLQLIARLASPGIVTEQEAANLAGGATPLATLATAFQKGGDEKTADLVRRSIDPNNPAFFDTEGLRALAKGLTASEAPFLMEELTDAKNRAQGNISKRAFDTNFGEQNIKSITGLSRFLEAKPDTSTKTKAKIPTEPPSGRQGGELRVDANGNRAFVFTDGSFEEI